MNKVNEKASPPISLDSSKERMDCQEEYKQDYLRLMGLVRDIRAEAQNLMKSLTIIKNKGELTDAEVRAREIKAALEEGKNIFKYNFDQIQKRIDSLRTLLDTIPCIYDLTGDEITNIENLFQRVSLAWEELSEEGNPIDTEQLLNRIANINKMLGEIIFHACLLTIPTRINQHLKHLRIGQTLDFHEFFKDELPPVKKYRETILADLYSHPRMINGVVDVKRGIVYNASPYRWRRFGSFLVTVAILIVGGLLIYFSPDIGKWLSLENWPVTPDKKVEYLSGYLFIIFGGFTHIGMGMLKESRAGKEQTFIALSDMILWIHIKELSIIAGIISLFIGFWGSALILQKIDWQTAFFVGYSIDSFIDIFLLRFTGIISSQTELLKGSLKTQKNDT